MQDPLNPTVQDIILRRGSTALLRVVTLIEKVSQSPAAERFAIALCQASSRLANTNHEQQDCNFFGIRGLFIGCSEWDTEGLLHHAGLLPKPEVSPIRLAYMELERNK